jgi:SLT domain-containing protein
LAAEELVTVLKGGKGQARIEALLKLRDLSADSGTQLQLASADLGLLPLLVAIVEADKGEERVCALFVLRNIALASENHVFLASAELRLLPLLVEVIKEDKATAREEALGTLWFLSRANPNKVPMASAELGLLPVLVEVAREDKWQARINATYTLQNISIAVENKVPMAATGLGLLPVLVEVVREDKGQARINAAAALQSISVAAENKVPMAAAELGLLAVLVEVVRADQGQAQINAATALQNISIAAENKVPMAAAELGLLPVLVEVVRVDQGQARKGATAALWNLSQAVDNRVQMACTAMGLLHVLVEVVRQDKGQARINAAAALQNLAIAAENKVPMVAPALGLLPVLVQVVREDRGQAQMKALGTLWNLSTGLENKVSMAAAELGLLPVLVEVVREDKGQARSDSLVVLKHLAAAGANIARMAATELGLLPVLVEVVREDCGLARTKALGVLLYLAELADTRKPIAAVLLPTLVQMVKEDKGEMRVNVIALLWELQKGAESEVLQACGDDLFELALEVLREGDFATKLAAAELLSHPPKQAGAVRQDLARECTKVLSDILAADLPEREELDVLGSLWNFTEYFEADYAPFMVQSGIPLVIAEKLREAGPVVAEWKGSTKYSKMLNYAMNLARHAGAVEAMKGAGYVELAYSLLAIPANGCERLKAMYMIAFLTGKDEQSQQRASVATEYPDLIPQLVTVLENTLNSVAGADQSLGTFCLRLTINACLVLSISDGNKKLLIQSNLLHLLVRTLRLFVSGGPPINLCGGGGDDVEAAELAVGTLTQLSFHYDSDATLQAAYLTSNAGLLDLLQGFITSEKTCNPAKDNARLLVKRLMASEPDKKDQDAVPVAEHKEPGKASTAAPAHIMLSYCWNATARPELVQQMHANLTTRGYDVWLDTVSARSVTTCDLLLTFSWCCLAGGLLAGAAHVRQHGRAHG